jgi:hypothetical protein
MAVVLPQDEYFLLLTASVRYAIEQWSLGVARYVGRHIMDHVSRLTVSHLEQLIRIMEDGDPECDVLEGLAGFLEDELRIRTFTPPAPVTSTAVRGDGSSGPGWDPRDDGYSQRQAAGVLGVGLGTIQRRIHAGELETVPYRTASGRIIQRVTYDSVQAAKND